MVYFFNCSEMNIQGCFKGCSNYAWSSIPTKISNENDGYMEVLRVYFSLNERRDQNKKGEAMQ